MVRIGRSFFPASVNGWLAKRASRANHDVILRFGRYRLRGRDFSAVKDMDGIIRTIHFRDGDEILNFTVTRH